MTYLKNELGFSMLVDVTAIDNGENADSRFTSIYHLLNIANGELVRIACDCEGNEEPEVPSVTHLWPAADWHERETYDMFGIKFVGHPDLRRILMWDEYEYYPLRKEFPLAGHEVEYPEPDIVERTDLKVKAAPMAGGPFVASTSGPMSKSEPVAKDQSWREYNDKPE